MSFYEERAQRTRAFCADRFGMFIHWGLYAIPAQGEWIRSNQRISAEDYQPYFEEFNPVRYDPKEWAALAKKAGMKYAVMTAKHHDGFCLFDSALTEYKSTKTPAGRDLIREYVDAFRAEGIKVGFYYSLLDWHHPDYPKYGDPFHPMRENEACKDEKIRFANYVEYVHGQVRELLTNYGRIDVMWFDFSYKNMSGETWEATKLVKMIRELQPGIVIDNRLGGDGKAAEPVIYAGDFESPEQILPSEGIADVLGRPVPWEACMTLNDNWGYHAKDKNYKSAKNVIHMLIECVSKGGNLLINVGPNAKGEIPGESVAILEQVGGWMRENSASIYGCGRADMPKPEWGRYTQRGKLLYAHIFERGVATFRFNGLEGKLKKARLLMDGSELKLLRPWMARDAYEADAFVDLGTADLPEPMGTVIELELL
ncbi:MAG: alpha-L-fucosidase [Oscillospiraceae bacterium]|jgi:alpha-L-fucosidase|nr:alpha-L-fucosidase [Oscillospiraceae bacterium]